MGDREREEMGNQYLFNSISARKLTKPIAKLAMI